MAPFDFATSDEHLGSGDSTSIQETKRRGNPSSSDWSLTKMIKFRLWDGGNWLCLI
jgi:hypothetical protein